MFDSERRRQENIKANQALLSELGVIEATANLGIGSSKNGGAKAEAKPVQRSHKSRTNKVVEEVTPRRQSSRLKRVAAADPDETPEAKRTREVSSLFWLPLMILSTNYILISGRSGRATSS